MAYTFKHLNKEQQDEIIAETSKAPTVPVTTDAMRAAWEADLLAHMCLAKTATGEEKERHDEAISTLEEALTKPAKA